MLNTILGIKKEMSSGYDTRGRRVAVTKILVEPNFVTQIKTLDKDSYTSVQLGTSSKKSVKKPQKGHFKKAGVSENLRFVKEVRVTEDDLGSIENGKEIKAGDVVRIGDEVKVTGTEKGRGFQGGVRRHGFHGGPKTHGQSDRHRAPGSIGTGTTPGRVLKGKKMAGHMGAEKATTRGLEVINVDKANNIVSIKGSVPGPYGGLVIITKTGQIKGYTPPPEEKEEEEEVPSDKEQMAAGDSSEVPQAEEKVEAKSEEAPAENSPEKPAEEVKTEEEKKE